MMGRTMAFAATVGCFAVAASLRAQQLQVKGLRTEYQENPTGIDVRAPPALAGA
jgi:hypothetical protein